MWIDVSDKCRLFKQTIEDVTELSVYEGPMKNSQGVYQKKEKQFLDEKPISLTFLLLSSKSWGSYCILPNKVCGLSCFVQLRITKSCESNNLCTNNYSFLILVFYSWLKVFPPCERSFDLVQIILVPCSAIIYLISRILWVLSILGFGHWLCWVFHFRDTFLARKNLLTFPTTYLFKTS